MILRDRVIIFKADGSTETVAAHVGVTSGAADNPSTESLFFAEKLRAVLPVRDVVIGETRIEWRGDAYVVSEQPLIRRRGDRDHHMTVTLERRLPDPR